MSSQTNNYISLEKTTFEVNKNKKPLVLDCFTFFNEFDLLETRLHELNDAVDYFVLVESTQTFTGKEKPLYFLENKERFCQFSKKIIHVIVDDMPSKNNKLREALDNIYYVATGKFDFLGLTGKRQAWNREFWQRNAIVRGLSTIKPDDDDIVIISDVDEIPSKNWVNQAKEITKERSGSLLIKKIKLLLLSSIPDGFWWKLPYSTRTAIDKSLGVENIFVAQQKYYAYFVNGFISDDWFGSTACSFATLRDVFSLKPSFLRSTVTVMFRGQRAPGGWHFSSLGGIDVLMNKIASFSHVEFNRGKYITKDYILERFRRGEDVFHDGTKISYVDLDSSYPEWMYQNPEKIKNLFFTDYL